MQRPLIAILLLLGLTAPVAAASSAPPVAEADSGKVQDSVVKIFTTVRYPDPYRPWDKHAPADQTGSGVVIDGKRILTNAHVVLYAGQIQVQGHQDGDKFVAHIVAVAPEIDLAILSLDDETFFDMHAPIQRATALPQVKDAVLAYGFPTGGESLSVTKGIISRIEYANFANYVFGLRIQIDAAINAGNSGGPAVVGERMIGLAFSRATGDTQNISYIIPNVEISLFLQDVADGRYDGKPAIRDSMQTLENPALRAFLGIDKGAHGIVVTEPYPSVAESPLHKWDVITRIADVPIDDQGMVALTPGLRVKFQYLVQVHVRDGKVPLTVLRAGRQLDISLPVSSHMPLLVPDLLGDYPPYFIYGPVVFSKVTIPFLSFLGSNGGMGVTLSVVGSSLVTRRGDLVSAEREELVVIASPFFPDPLIRGYGNHSGSVVSAVNGVQIRSLRHLVETLRDLQDDYVVIDFDHRGAESLVLSRKDMLAATDHILADNGVRLRGSDELMEVWNAGKAPRAN